MAGFRRAQLRGSEELFRQTSQEEGSTPRREPAAVDSTPRHQDVPVPDTAPASPSLQAKEAPRRDAAPATIPEGTVRVALSQWEIEILADAVQKMKFPSKVAPRPSVDEFERLEELRQRLLDLLGHQ